jgi:hypothetical protein
MTSKTPPSKPDHAAAPDHQDSALESIGKAITDTVWESSGEADASEKGDERRAASQRTPPEAPAQS